MEPWFSGAVVDAVREAKSRRALFIVYVRDDTEQSQSMDKLWLDVWTNLNNTSNIIALRLNKDTEACKQFTAIYKVQVYPTIYLINGQNGQVLKMIDQVPENSNQLQEIVEDSLNIIEPKQAAASPPSPPTTNTKSVEERVAEARARLKELHDKREEEAKEKEKDDELNRRRLGQQMLLDKQKKDEELIRQQAEQIRRDKLEQQKLQEKLKAQIQQDREEKRRKYEQEQTAASATIQQTKSKPPSSTTTEVETPKINYTRSRLQFRLTDGSFFTEDFPFDARMNDVYAYLQETLPTDQYRNGSYTLRTIHTRVTLTRDNPNTLKELELCPSAVLLVLNRTNVNSPSMNVATNNIFQSIPLIFTWFMMQFNLIYQFILRKFFGNRTQTEQQTRVNNSSNQEQQRPTVTKHDTFRTDSTEKSTIRRFHNTEDDSDDEEKRTWNGNSTQQL